MKHSIIMLMSLVAFPVFAGELRVYQTDAYGNIQYHKPSYTVTKDGRVTQTDPYGNKRYGMQEYQIKGDKVVPVSALGYRQYNKATLVFGER